MDNDELYRRLTSHGRIYHYEAEHERREQPRVMVFLKGSIQSDEEQFAVVTRDVSRSGVGLISYQPFEVGCTLMLELSVPWNATITREIRIVRCEEKSGFYDVAGVFT